MKVSKNTAVAINYVLTDDSGKIIDQSLEGEPLCYLHGHNNIIAGLENALTGKIKGDNLKVTVAPKDGYGEYQESLVQTLPKKSFKGAPKIEVGMQFHAQTNSGMQVLTVKKVDNEKVTVDGNHPLAGTRLHFDVTVGEIREATKEELDHGHVHGAGCQHQH